MQAMGIESELMENVTLSYFVVSNLYFRKNDVISLLLLL